MCPRCKPISQACYPIIWLQLRDFLCIRFYCKMCKILGQIEIKDLHQISSLINDEQFFGERIGSMNLKRVPKKLGPIYVVAARGDVRAIILFLRQLHRIGFKRLCFINSGTQLLISGTINQNSVNILALHLNSSYIGKLLSVLVPSVNKTIILSKLQKEFQHSNIILFCYHLFLYLPRFVIFREQRNCSF